MPCRAASPLAAVGKKQITFLAAAWELTAKEAKFYDDIRCTTRNGQDRSLQDIL